MYRNSELVAGALVAALMSLEGEVIPVSGATPVLEVHWDETVETTPGVAESFQIQAERDGVSFLITLETNEAQTRLPVSAIAVSGTATSTSTATGTLSVSALPADVSGDTAVAETLAPATDPLTPAITAESELVPIKPVSISGTATLNSTATGTLGVAGVSLDVSTDTYPADQLAPDRDASSALHHASEDNHAIPVDGSVAPAGDAAPLEDDSADIALSLAPPEWHGPYPDHDPDFSPVAVTGTATSTSTATGTLSVAGATIEPTDYVPLDGPDQDAATAILMAADGEVIPVSGAAEAPGDAPPGADDSDAIALSLTPPEYHGPYPEHELPVNPRAITGTATSTSTATGTLSVAGSTVDVSADTEVADKLAPASDPITPQFQAEADHQIPIKPVSISGTATSTSTATGTLSVGRVNLDVSGDTAVAELIAPDRDATVAIFHATLNGEIFAESGAVTVVPGQPGTATISDGAPTATLSDSAPTAELSDSAPSATLSDAIP